MTAGRRVGEDEAALWRRTIRDVAPLREGAQDRPAGLVTDADKAPKPVPAAPASPRRPRAGPKPPPAPLALDPGAPSGLDWRTARRLKRGEIPVEARLDLHGMTQEEAHAALGAFVRASRAAGRHCIQVITGKGSVDSAGAGVLRRMTPRWLEEPSLRRHVVAIAHAPPRGGGRGALTVLLKRGPPPAARP